MVAARRIIALSVASDQRQRLVEISRSRTEPANRVERAGIILAYLDEPSAYGVAQRMGLTRQTVKRCLERAAELGVVAALDDLRAAGATRRSPRQPGLCLPPDAPPTAWSSTWGGGSRPSCRITVTSMASDSPDNTCRQ
jgi:hypothetical protein